MRAARRSSAILACAALFAGAPPAGAGEVVPEWMPAPAPASPAPDGETADAPSVGDAPAGASTPAATPPPAATGASAATPTPPRGSNPLARLPLIGRFFGDAEEGGPDPTGDRVAPHYLLEIDAPDGIERDIRDHTLLGRWRQRRDFDPSQLPLFVRRAEGEVRDLLAAEGWFTPDVRVDRIEGGVRIAVVAGPRTVVKGTAINLAGPIAAPEHASLRERIERSWTMADGAPFRSEDWERAKRGVLAQTRDAGFLRARIEDSEAIVDAPGARASLRIDIESGRPLAFGGLSIHGLQRYPAEVVEGLRPFAPGDPYDARPIADFQTRLNGAGWFSTVNVRPDTAALERDPELEAVPIRIDVVERQAKRWTLGGGYDTDRGFNVLLGWEHRNVFGRGVQTFNGLELDVERQAVFSTWDTPQDLDGRRWQFGARAEHIDVQNDLVDAVSVFGSRNRRRGDIETAVSLQYQFERQNVVFSADDVREYDNRAVVLGYAWTQRKLDSPIFPSSGYILSGQLSGASESLGSMQSFVRGYGFGYAIVPLAVQGGAPFGRLVVRGEVGAVVADSRDGIPSANLFRTGGVKSIRGYASQSLGVPLGQAVVGGRYLLTTSVEYQHPIDPDIALAAFYDRGNAADDWKALAPVSGWGIGVRWRTPVGPLNLDLARGVAVGEWRLHFAIGVVF